MVCEGLDTRCDLYINGKFLAHTNNMHRSYYFEVASYLVDGENELKAVFPPYDAYIKSKTKEQVITSGSSATLIGFAYVRKAFYMAGWDWGQDLCDGRGLYSRRQYFKPFKQRADEEAFAGLPVCEF